MVYIEIQVSHFTPLISLSKGYLYYFLYFYFFLFLAVLGVCCCMGFLQLQQAGATLHCSAWASHCVTFLVAEHGLQGALDSVVAARGLSVCGFLGSSRTGSVAVAHGLSQSLACGIFPDQESHPCLPHWQVDSLPLSHQGSPGYPYYTSFFQFILLEIFCADTRKNITFHSQKWQLVYTPSSMLLIPAQFLLTECTQKTLFNPVVLQSGWTSQDPRKI